MMKSGTFSKWPLHWTCALKQKTNDSVWNQILRKLIEQSTEEHCGEDGVAMLSEHEETANEEEDKNTSEPVVCLATTSLQTFQKDSTGGAFC
ncbi:hypothetical protein ILYODFUR_032547, partial [Ilyodon furcidens]